MVSFMLQVCHTHIWRGVSPMMIVSLVGNNNSTFRGLQTTSQYCICICQHITSVYPPDHYLMCRP